MRSLAVLVAMAVLLTVSVAKDEVQVGDLVKKHLESIGTEQARAAVKNRAVAGTLTFEILNRSGRQDGKQVMVSEGNKLVSLLKLPNPSYHGERFVSDGKDTVVAELKPGIYSTLGSFIRTHGEILTEGLWGGTLSTGWALAHLDERSAKLEDRGLKKVDGRDLRRVDYVPRKRTDLEIQLYFEPDTLRHVMTAYSLSIGAGIARTDKATARQQDTHYRLEEHFADFKSVDNLNLPQSWTVKFTSDVPLVSTSGRTAFGAAVDSISQFEVTETSISHNVQIDPKNFEVK